MNCRFRPRGEVGFAGVTVMDCSDTGLTVRSVLAEMVPEVAVMVDVPPITAVARPEALIVATAVVPEFHVTEVNVCADPSV